MDKRDNVLVVLGSCSIDFTTYASRLPKPGETVHGNKFVTSYGGKGANQCIAAAKLGAKPYMICRLGADEWGHNYKEYFLSNGVDASFVNITPNVTTGIAQISVASTGENQIVIVPGANGHLSVNDVNNANDIIENANIIIGQLETPIESTLAAFKLNKGIKLLNAAPANTDIQELLQHCTILCVNEPEASLLTGLEVDNVRAAVAALTELLKTGCETAIITLGEDGAVYSTKAENKPIHVLCDAVTPVDTTGAGDAFVGALATYLISETYKNYPLHQIIGAACHIASLSVTKEGTQTSYPSDYNAFEKEYKYVKL